MKMKEEAIQRAVMGAMAPVAQAPPQQTPGICVVMYVGEVCACM